MGSTTCQACGASLTGSTAPQVKGPPPIIMAAPSSTTAAPQSQPRVRTVQSQQTSVSTASALATNAQSTSAAGLFGWRTLDGRVIQVEPIYMGAADFRWDRLLVKIALLGTAIYFFGVAILAVFAILLVLLWLISKIMPKNFVSGVAVQVVSFMLTRRLVGPVTNVPIRDIRIRDSANQEFLVRLKGQLISGSISVGDDVVLAGWDRGGTVIFKRGFNKRIRTDIRIKCP